MPSAIIKEKLAFYTRVMWFSAHVYASYPWEIVALLMRRVFEVGLLLVFWHIVQQSEGLTDHRNFPAYILIASSVQLLTVGHNFRLGGNMADDIKSGAISNILLKPISTLNYYVANNLGRQIIVQAFAVTNIIVGLLLLSGVSAARLGLFALSFAVSWVLAIYMNVLIGAVAFWIIEHSNFRLLIFFAMRVISGFFVPLTFFPGALEKFLLTLPFAQFAFVPGEILTGNSSTTFLLVMLGIGVAWIVVLRFVAIRVWEAGRKHNDAIGL